MLLLLNDSLVACEDGYIEQGGANVLERSLLSSCRLKKGIFRSSSWFMSKFYALPWFLKSYLLFTSKTAVPQGVGGYVVQFVNRISCKLLDDFSELLQIPANMIFFVTFLGLLELKTNF